MSDDERWMGLALALGRRAWGRVWPNPSVGCVIVRDGRVLGRGWTADGGRPHADAGRLGWKGRRHILEASGDARVGASQARTTN